MRPRHTWSISPERRTSRREVLGRHVVLVHDRHDVVRVLIEERVHRVQHVDQRRGSELAGHVAQVEPAGGRLHGVRHHHPVGAHVRVVGVEQEPANAERELLRDPHLLVRYLPSERGRRHRVVSRGQDDLIELAVAVARVAVAADGQCRPRPRRRAPATGASEVASASATAPRRLVRSLLIRCHPSPPAGGEPGGTRGPVVRFLRGLARAPAALTAAGPVVRAAVGAVAGLAAGTVVTVAA